MKQKRKNLNEFVSSNKEIRNGLPVFKGTRVPVYVVLEYLALGWTLKDLKKAFPAVKSEYVSGLVKSFSEKFRQA